MASSKRRRRSPRRSLLRRWFVVSGFVTAAAGALYFWSLYRRVDQFILERSLSPLQIYSDALVLQRGMNVDGARLTSRLRRLGYEERRGGPVAAGQFRPGHERFDVNIRPFRDPSGEYPLQAVRLELEDGVIREVVRSNDGESLPQARLEPELLGSYSGGVLGERRAIRLNEVPGHVVAAVLAAEDARFASHSGIDPIGLVRALIANLRGGRVRQGGSTITQQLAKNAFLSPERSLVRKINEALIALILEARLSKDEILELYLNDVYLGRSGSIGIYGIGPAARAFFAKEPAELSVAEAATIAGIIHAPNADSPLRHPDRGRTRRDLVLQLMADNGWLAPKELEAARAEPLQVSRRPAQPLEAPFFVDEVLRRLTKMGYEAGLVRGLSVYTSIDLETQHLSERSLAAGLESLERSYARIRRPDDPVEGASILIEAGTGYVRALAGGRDFSRSQFNRVTRSRRQPGSAFKPFVYLAALDDPDEVITPATILRDEPLVLRVGQADWSPTNYDGRFLGEVTVRTAIEGSRNIPTVALAERIGFDRVTALARLAGLGSPPTVPSIALGSEEVSLLDLAGAYTVFPNLGEVLRPALIRGVMTQDGGLLYQDRLKARRVATASAAYVTSHLLEGVVDEGTGAAVRKLGIAQPVAGKTGTTNDEKDAWFIGYSPDWVAGVWVGFDDGTSLGLTGARAALPIWTTLMKDVLVFYEERPFSVPQGVVFRDVDRYSGLLASWSCSDTIREAFVAGTEPTMTCDGRPVQPEDLDEREGGRSSARRRPAPWDGVDHWFRRLFRTR